MAGSKQWQVPDAVGDNHPKYDEVVKALAGHGEMPTGIMINFGWRTRWLMDHADGVKYTRQLAGLDPETAEPLDVQQEFHQDGNS
jgi:hypothetical protein